MRTTFALALLAAAAFGTETAERVRFQLPAPDGRAYGVQDFDARYVLLVYQGIP